MTVHAPIRKTQEHWFRGEERSINIKVKDAAGAPVNISAFALRWRLQQNNGDDATVYLTKTSGGGGITVANGDGTNDMAVVAMTAADFANVPSAGRGQTLYHVLWRTDTDVVLAEGPAFLGEAGSGA